MIMTLESISELLERGYIDAYDDPAQVKASIDAAIRERDELRSLWARDKTAAVRYLDRAEKAEAELAALKARIANAPEAYLTSRTGIGPCNIASLAHGAVFDSTSYGKSVRLVVEE